MIAIDREYEYETPERTDEELELDYLDTLEQHAPPNDWESFGLCACTDFKICRACLGAVEQYEHTRVPRFAPILFKAAAPDPDFCYCEDDNICGPCEAKLAELSALRKAA